jgi:hypothetical protein
LIHSPTKSAEEDALVCLRSSLVSNVRQTPTEGFKLSVLQALHKYNRYGGTSHFVNLPPAIEQHYRNWLAMLYFMLTCSLPELAELAESL